MEKTLTRRNFLRVSGAGIASITLLGATSCATTNGGNNSGEEFPSREIRFIVPYSAGGGTDLLVRAIAPRLEERLGQTIVVENRAGGSGSAAIQQVIQSQPDGHTVTTVNPGPSIVSPLINDVGYTKSDYATIGRIATSPLVLSVPADSPYDSAEELFEAARESPGTIDIATPGSTVSQTIELRLLQQEENVEFQLVPFDGGSKAINAVLGGNVDAAFTGETDVASQIESGDLEGLATTADASTELLPDVPAFKEQGIEPALATGPYGMATHKDTPQEIITRWETALRETLEQEEVQEEIRQLGLQPDFLGSQEFRQRVNEISNLYQGVLEEEESQ